MIKQIAKTLLPGAVTDMVKMQHSRRIEAELSRKNISVPQSLMDGTTLLSDRLTMLDRLPRSAIVAEIGVWRGDFSQEIMARCTPTKLYLIDIWSSSNEKFDVGALQAVHDKLGSEISSSRVELIRNFSVEALEKIDDNTFDWVYVDAAHDYKNVRADLEACRRVVKPGGIIAGHDYLRHDRHFNRYGVVEAVNEFVVKYNCPFIYLTNEPNKHDSYAIRNLK